MFKVTEYSLTAYVIFTGGLYGSKGFVGCMRYIHIEGHYIRVTSLAKHQFSSEGVVFDACQMSDR